MYVCIGAILCASAPVPSHPEIPVIRELGHLQIDVICELVVFQPEARIRPALKCGKLLHG